MAETGKISGLTRISGLDRANDLFEVDDVSLGASKSATVNDMLGITGAPLGSTDSQVITNKTFGITNTITALDSTFSIVDNADNTKVAQFQASGITTGTTRTYTLPNVSDTLVSLTASQTLTNKTLTSPTITTPTINNPTLNTDAISEFTVGNGVTVGGVKLKSGALATNNSVITSNITDGNVTPAKLVAGTGAGWATSSWVPTWTNFTVGNAVVSYKYIQTGKMVDFLMTVVLGTTSAMSTDPTFTLPVTAASSYTTSVKLGDWHTFIASEFYGVVLVSSTTIGRMYVYNAAATSLTSASITSTVPGTWTTGTPLAISGRYEAA